MRRAARYLTICLLMFGAVALTGTYAKGSDDIATLAPSVELRTVEEVDVPFQHGVPYPSFEVQKTRMVEDLGGSWKFRSLPSTSSEISKSLSARDNTTISMLEADGYHAKEFDDSSWETVVLPRCENPIGVPVDENVYWYRRTISEISGMKGKYVKLVLLGANYITDVWVNGKYVGWHEGGFTSFVFDVSGYLNYDDSDVIAIRVHNIPWNARSGQMDIMPYQTCDFRNYGGIYRDVYLEAVDNLSIARVDVKPSLKVEDGDVVQDSGHIDVTVVLYNHGSVVDSGTVSLSVFGTRVDENNILDPAPEAIMDPDAPVQVTGGTVKAGTVPPEGVTALSFSLDLSGIRLWTPEDPALYVLKAALNDGTDVFCTQFGVREVSVDGSYPRLLLNRVPTFLAGAARHESMPDVYRKFTSEQMENLKRDLDLMKEANVNFIRTAHYPNHPFLYVLADRMGFMVWEEMSATWFVDDAFEVHMKRGTAKQMWLEMIYRDYNRPSIIIWSTTNEADIHQPEPAPGISHRYKFNQEMKELARRVDGTRLVTQATFWNVDPTWDVDDVLGINEYQGVFYYPWAPTIGDYYLPTREALERSHEAQPDKPIIASEMGMWSTELMLWTSEQSRCFEDTFRALYEKPYVSGTTWWCMFDWWQAPGTAQTMGAITWDRGFKKDVYYRIQEAYENTWTNPWVKILSPSDGDIISGTVEIRALAEDFRGDQPGVESVEFSIDEGPYLKMTPGGDNVWTYTWDSSDVPDGAHELTVTVVDHDGQTRSHSISLILMNRFEWSQTDWSGHQVPRRYEVDENTVGLWRFERLRHDVAEDDSGSGNHGIATGVELVDGMFGYGIKLENSGMDTGTAPSVKIPYNEDLNFVSGDFTVQLWVKPEIDYPATSGLESEKGWRLFVRQDNRINGDWWDGCWWIGYDEWWNELSFVVRDAEGGENKVAYRFSLEAGRWYNITGVKDGPVLKLYIDGVLRATGDSPPDYQPCGDLYIGYHRDNPSDPIFLTFNGVIDEVRIRRGALSDEEVAAYGAWAQVGSWGELYDNYSWGENIDTSTFGTVRLSKVGNRPPTADFSYSPWLPTVEDNNNAVQFTDLSTDPDGSITSWLWDFGDGTTSTERNPLHVYERDGVYDVTLTVTDDNGASDMMSDVVTVYWKTQMFQDFEPGNGTPDDYYYYDAWSASPDFEYTNVREGTRSVVMHAHGGSGGGQAHGGTIGITVADPSAQINLQNADSLFMWVYDTQGNNTVELRLRDTTGVFGPCWWSNDHPALGVGGIAVKDEWTLMAWDLTRYTGTDKSRITGIELYEWWDGDYYFDEVWVGIGSGFTVTSDKHVGRFPNGGSTDVEVTVGAVGFYDNVVELSCVGLPDGVTADFSVSSGKPGFSSTMHLEISPGTAPGVYPLQIFGVGADGKVRYCTYTLVVGEKSFQDFEESNGTPGENYTYEVYYTTRKFEVSTVHEGARSLGVLTRATRDGHPGEHGGAFGVNAASPTGYMNLENATTIALWIYDTQGNNTVELTVVDEEGASYTYGYSPGKSVRGRWTMLTWDISGPCGDVDMSRIRSLQFYLWWDGYYYFDDISYIEGEVQRVAAQGSSSGSSGRDLGIGLPGAVVDSVGQLSADGFGFSTQPNFHVIQSSSASGRDDYRPRGVLVSSIFDAGMSVYWGTVSWSAETPPPTSVKVYVRAGENRNPADGGWTEWCEAQNGSDLPLSGRYVQYMVVLETEDGEVTPVFEDISLAYSLSEESLASLWLLLLAAVGVGAGLYYAYRRRKRSVVSQDWLKF